MTTFKKLTLLSLFTFGLFFYSFAQTAQKKVYPVRLLITGALELGGDEVAEVYFTNGNTQSVNAGQGGSIAIGGQFAIPALEKLLLRATVGYKYVTTEADNAHIRLTRVPVQFTANWMLTNKWRLGGGLAMHRGIRFKADGIGKNISFDAAKGPVFEVAYRGIGLIYTAMKYKDEMNHTYSANAIGLTFSVTIPGAKQ
jgi:hypothetical protein